MPGRRRGAEVTAASATVTDYGHTVSVEFESGEFGTVKRHVLFSPEEAVAVYEALHEWVSGDKEGNND
jgi:hypothetical protein